MVRLLLVPQAACVCVLVLALRMLVAMYASERATAVRLLVVLCL